MLFKFSFVIFLIILSFALEWTACQQNQKDWSRYSKDASLISNIALMLTLFCISTHSMFSDLFAYTVSLQCYDETDMDSIPVTQCVDLANLNCHLIPCPSQSVLNSARLFLYPSAWAIRMLNYSVHVIVFNCCHFPSNKGYLWVSVTTTVALFSAQTHSVNCYEPSTVLYTSSDSVYTSLLHSSHFEPSQELLQLWTAHLGEIGSVNDESITSREINRGGQ